MKLGQFLFRHRGVTPYPIVLIFALFAEPTISSFIGGSVIIAIGEALRIWCVAYLGPDSRKLEVQVNQLVTVGPYSIVRNPIYIGNIILYTGTTVIANLWMPYFLLFAWLYFGFQYYHIVKLEEKELSEVFGASFYDYLQRTPRFVPNTLSPIPSAAQQPNYKVALISEKSTFLSIVGILLLFVLRMIF